MVVEASSLTWAAVQDLLRNSAPEGLTNQEMAEAFKADYRRIAMLTKLMYEAGALSRMVIGRSERATALYFLPN